MFNVKDSVTQASLYQASWLGCCGEALPSSTPWASQMHSPEWWENSIISNCVCEPRMKRGCEIRWTIDGAPFTLVSTSRVISKLASGNFRQSGRQKFSHTLCWSFWTFWHCTTTAPGLSHGDLRVLPSWAYRLYFWNPIMYCTIHPHRIAALGHCLLERNHIKHPESDGGGKYVWFFPCWHVYFGQRIQYKCLRTHTHLDVASCIKNGKFFIHVLVP